MADGKPQSGEKEYFAREEAEKLRKLALERSLRLEEEEREKLKELHYMHCPKCGQKMDVLTYRNVEIDRCFACGYTGLDDGELEELAGEEEEGGVMSAVLGIFKAGKK